ncbi:MAG: SAM-dependent methyltransferase [Clostridia bacterium]|nr:SAM-dependent methyltransferase [Clostridia bacterium]
MAYGKRIDTLCSLLKKVDTFADVGCDHGYCSEYMLKNGLCEKAILSDVSKGSLAKAETLLAPYIRQGKAVSVLGDGFFGVSSDVDEVLIAGMGGSEIVSILSNEKHGFMPKYFVFQPMHDAEKLRRYILENGGYIEKDYTFQDVKFYDVIVGGRREEGEQVFDETPYTDAEYEFGRDNLKTFPDAFTARIRKLLSGIDRYLAQPNLQDASKEDLLNRKARLEGVLSGEIK